MSDNPEAVTHHWRIETWFPDLDPNLLNHFKVYNEELVKFNKTVSLVPPKSIPVADALHFSDSILASRVITKSPNKFNEIYDLGSGNGFPGLVFALLNPSIKVHLVEMDQKKCEFLRHVIFATGVKNADVICTKIESMKENSISHAMVRGFASISKTVLLTRKLVVKGGVLFHLKGEEWGMEVSDIPIQLCSSWAPSLVGEYRLPVGEVRFSIIKTDKIA
ncbi:MAG: 16S rRNA (guanine(527)-N(7))-methyltransferase RsmG [Bdellovibrionaceae bacterium]|nr:16S rRNA (guanine(527)-N(7))-methyltransferase RsmG [Pseudobdellovibrionaceae bacterium]